MHDSERHRSIAADCLSEAYGGRQPGHRNLNLFVAAAWLSLARQGEAIENVIASWNTPKVPERLSFFRVFLDVLGSLFSRLKCFQSNSTISLRQCSKLELNNRKCRLSHWMQTSELGTSRAIHSHAQPPL